MLGGWGLDIQLRYLWRGTASRDESGSDEGRAVEDDAIVDGLVNDRRQAYFPSIPLIGFGELCSNMAVVSFLCLFLTFDPGEFFFNAAPVKVNMFLDKPSMHDVGLAKTVWSRQHAVSLGEGEVGYRVGS